MSQTNDTTINNNKRPAHTTTTTTTTYLPAAMKKAKSEAVASSLDRNKNGIPFCFDDPPSPTNIEDDPTNPNYDVVAHSSGGGGVTSNLSRKKATPPHPAKKLVIKLLKAKPTLPTNFEDNTWASLKSAISAIFLKQPDPCDLEKLYQASSTHHFPFYLDTTAPYDMD
ncbi:hypothetical protein RHGRI_036759 [Rhododendron griersonianum]|uniref:Uncharacterized protein n=1 Tax=Rhododendron griersonianum TaxID=479676 RepID=A0AAV6HQ90_9ERIC|nr:hypothetical protein RHGRI_036759 [Rhododendron griersonianum]